MTLYMKEKDSLLRDRLLVTDDAGKTVYRIEGKLLSNKLTIEDDESRPLATVRKKPLALTPKYAIEIEGEEVALLHKESSLTGKPYYKVEGPDWTVDGDIWDRDYNIRHSLNVIARVKPPILGSKDSYKIKIEKESLNPMMVVAVAVIVDCILDEEDTGK